MAAHARGILLEGGPNPHPRLWSHNRGEETRREGEERVMARIGTWSVGLTFHSYL